MGVVRRGGNPRPQRLALMADQRRQSGRALPGGARCHNQRIHSSGLLATACKAAVHILQKSPELHFHGKQEA
eukprot:12447613-Alexandrium_andersonii.AAC.1